MVSEVSPVYLFIGQDSLSKNVLLAKLKAEFLPARLEDFNLDTLYATDLNLRTLQERLLSLPVKTAKRLIVIKEAGSLKEELKRFIISYVKKPSPKIILILDVEQKDPRDEFINSIWRYAQIYHFKESTHLDTFMLSRQIDLKKTAQALGILNQLLKNGERPERILGGLRYACERKPQSILETQRRLSALMECDIDIKTGRIKPDFALERLVISLCGLTQF